MIVEIGTVITTIIAVFDKAFKNSLSLNKLIQFLPSLKTKFRFKLPLSLG